MRRVSKLFSAIFILSISNAAYAGHKGANFSFVGAGQDTISIHPRDSSRGVVLGPNVNEERVLYSDGSGKSFPLYSIIKANGEPSIENHGQVEDATSVRVIEYSCNEDIPLILEIEQSGDEFSALWEHDSIRGNRLDQVISASGVKFSDGRNEIHAKGNSVYINLDGIEDTCIEVENSTAIPPKAQDPDDKFVWDYSQYDDISNNGHATSNLIYGIPETDAVQIFGQCNAGSSGNFSTVDFGADVEGLRDGQAVTISFSTGNFSRQLDGEVIGTQAEVGITGVRVTLDNNDALWDALRRGQNLKYLIKGKGTSASLRGSNTPIKKFVEDCKNYAGSSGRNN